MSDDKVQQAIDRFESHERSGDTERRERIAQHRQRISREEEVHIPPPVMITIRLTRRERRQIRVVAKRAGETLNDYCLKAIRARGEIKRSRDAEARSDKAKQRQARTVVYLSERKWRDPEISLAVGLHQTTVWKLRKRLGVATHSRHNNYPTGTCSQCGCVRRIRFGLCVCCDLKCAENLVSEGVNETMREAVC